MDILIRLVVLILFIELVNCDCGLPAIPYNAHIDKVQQIYYGDETVEYHCELDELKLVGNSTRKCVNSKWEGTIPKCVEELYFGTIKSIELADSRNHTFDFDKSWWRRGPNSAAYHADSNREKCLASTSMNRPHTWKLHLSEAKRHISYIEIELTDKDKRLSKTNVRSIVKYAKVNDLRECSPKIMATTDTTVRLSLNCLIEFEGDSKYEVWEKDQVKVIEIEFDQDVIQICEIRLFTNSFMPFHRCGSADVVLYSTMEFVKSSNKYNGFSYSCDQGFQLEGSEDVRCGLNNEWMDPFPTCKPVITCPFPSSKTESLSVNINFEHLFNFEGNYSAIVGSVIAYECVGEHNNQSIMIGDSVRVCGPDGKWTGVEPTCIHDYELNSDYFTDIVNNRKDDEYMTTVGSFSSILRNESKTYTACGIPAMPLFAKPTSQMKYKLFGGQSDLRLFYTNGTVINYQCESAYRWVAGDVGKRTCVEGKWVGNVGKCAVNHGNKISLYSIYVFDLDDKGKWINQHNVMETNNTNAAWDQHFAYRRDADKEGECATFTVEAKHRWHLRLNQSTLITYFTVMLHPGGFFGNKRMINDPKVLETSPVSAAIGEKNCVLTSAWDYTHSKVGTYFFFTCDLDDQTHYNYNTDYSIDLTIEPKKFISSYKAKNISLCSLAVLASTDSCGTPDIPLHSTATHNQMTRDWTYACEEGYFMIGSPTVSCGKNGRWIGEFPTCQKRELCPTTHPIIKMFTGLQTTYKNLKIVDGKEVAVIDSLASYSCVSDPDNKRLLIGPSLRICKRNGQWSGSEPFCMDPKDLPHKKSSSGHSGFAIFGICLSVLVGFSFLVGLFWYAFKRGFIGITANCVPTLSRNPNVPKIHIHRESSIDVPKDMNGNESNGRIETHKSEVPAKATKVNEVLPVFTTGTELLIEPDFDND